MATRILPDELLSSWLVRTALAHGCDPLALTGYVWPKWRIWTQDVDRTVTADRLPELARLSGIPQDELEAATLLPVSKRISGTTLPRTGTWPWILTLGARNRRRRGGMQFCPECLATDRDPYYRIQWRFAWHTGCERHGCGLLDRCWECKAPLEPHRLLAIDGHIAKCATCSKDLRSARPITWSATAREFQLTADKVLAEQVGVGLGHSLTAPEWFSLSAYLTALLRQALRIESGNLRAMIESVASVTLPDILLVDSNNIEQLRTFERRLVFEVVAKILAVDTEAFLAACVSQELSRQSLFRSHRSLPRVVSGLSLVLNDCPREKRSRSRTSKRMGPQPRYVVKRMMARLVRRARQETS